MKRFIGPWQVIAESKKRAIELLNYAFDLRLTLHNFNQQWSESDHGSEFLEVEGVYKKDCRYCYRGERLKPLPAGIAWTATEAQ